MAQDPQAPTLVEEAPVEEAPEVSVDIVELSELVEDVSIDGMCGVY
jgi:mycofactocin precursor